MANTSSSDRDPVERLAEEFLARRRNGEKPSLSEYVERHPELADDIRAAFPALLLMERADPASSELSRQQRGSPVSPAVPAELGDFRILREVARGGMGVVYEAEQVSLGRRVALKVLPPQAQANARYLARFEREAKAAARLHHTNIVPVYGVGTDHGIHYYAMQFIQGLPLDEVLHEVKHQRNGIAGAPVPQSAAAAASAARSLLTGVFPRGDATVDQEPAFMSAPQPPSVAANLSGQADGGSPYWQSVARIGAQVAAALAYAHGEGVLHRDIKPSNLLLDARGHVWVADFGLAKVRDSDDLTNTGDIVGTLRYMAPEVFDGQSDARSDIYALGLTLYEAVALAPAFDESDRNKLIKQVTTNEPPRLSKVAPRLPRDLATIIHKAIDKDPARRFQAAEALADDLRRFLEDRPIRARRSHLLERSWRWCRRNKTAALLIVASLVALLSVGAAMTALWFNTELTESNVKLAAALEDAGTERKKAEQFLYFNKITLAGREWWDFNVGRADQLLTECPVALRGWEWYFLKRNSHLEHRTLSGHAPQAHHVAYSPDGKLLASCGQDQTVRVWDARTGALVGSREFPHSRGIGCVAFAPDGDILAALDTSGIVRVWNGGGKEVAELRLPDEHAPFMAYCLAFSPRGQHLAAGTWALDPQKSSSIVVWETARWEKTRTLSMPHQRVAAVAFDAAEKGLFAVLADILTNPRKKTVCEFRAWDLADGKTVGQFSWPVLGYAEAAFSPDGRWLAASNSDGSIQIWDRQAAKERHTLQGHTGVVIRLAFSGDSARLASAGDDQSIRLWDVADGELLGVLRGHTAWVNKVAFHPDGRWLASASDDGTVKIWDISNTTDVRPLKGPADLANCALLGPDGRWLVVQTSPPNPKHLLWDRQLQKEVVPYPFFRSTFSYSDVHAAIMSSMETGSRARWKCRTAEGHSGAPGSGTCARERNRGACRTPMAATGPAERASLPTGAIWPRLPLRNRRSTLPLRSNFGTCRRVGWPGHIPRPMAG